MPWVGGTPTRTDGTRTGQSVWDEAAVAVEDILSNDHDTHDQDLANMIGDTVHRGGQNTPSANLPMGGKRHLNVGNGTARDNYAAMGQVQDNVLNYAADTGAADAYAIAPSIAITAYAAGQVFWFIAANANTGASTLAVSGLAAQTLRKYGAATESGDIPANAAVGVVYNGTQFDIFSVSTRPLEDSDLGVTVQPFDAATLKSDETASLTVGYKAEEHDEGTVSAGAFQPDHADGNFQEYTNGGNHTLAPPTFSADSGTMVIRMTNNASAGNVTTTNFDIVTGDSLTTTNGDKFFFHITVMGNDSHLQITALQ